MYNDSIMNDHRKPQSLNPTSKLPRTKTMEQTSIKQNTKFNPSQTSDNQKKKRKKKGLNQIKQL